MADQLPAPNFSHPYGGRGPLIMSISWVEASIALVLMLMRTYCNAFVVKSFKWDYFWALLTLVTSMITMALLTVSVSSGLGNHISLLEPSQIVTAMEWAWIAQCLLIQSIGFGKYAVIAFILRIQDRAQTRKNTVITYLLYFIGVSNFFINITMMTIILTSCSPGAKFWNSALPGTCNHVIRTDHMGYFQGSWAALSDVVLAVVPIVVFWSLKISVKLKIGLCLLMAGGLLAAAAGVLKTINVKQLTVETDTTYALSSLVIWAWSEVWLILILGSLPPLRPLFAQVFQRISTKDLSNRNRGYYDQSDPKGIPMNSIESKRTPKDTDSERFMLSMGVGILRTTDVQVVSNTKDSRENSNESLNGVERGAVF